MHEDLKEGTLHEQLKGELLQQYEESFPRWFSELQAGFNLLFYGFGSKKTLLEKFASEFFEDYPCVVVYPLLCPVYLAYCALTGLFFWCKY